MWHIANILNILKMLLIIVLILQPQCAGAHPAFAKGETDFDGHGVQACNRGLAPSGGPVVEMLVGLGACFNPFSNKRGQKLRI